MHICMCYYAFMYKAILFKKKYQMTKMNEKKF